MYWIWKHLLNILYLKKKISLSLCLFHTHTHTHTHTRPRKLSLFFWIMSSHSLKDYFTSFCSWNFTTYSSIPLNWIPYSQSQYKKRRIWDLSHSPSRYQYTFTASHMFSLLCSSHRWTLKSLSTPTISLYLDGLPYSLLKPITSTITLFLLHVFSQLNHFFQHAKLFKCLSF